MARKRNVLSVHDFAYSSAQGRRRLLQFLGSFDGQADKVSMHLPSSDPLVFDFARNCAAANTVLQARLIGAKAALEAGSSPYDFILNLKLKDKVCAWNQASFSVQSEGGVIRCKPSSGLTDVSMDSQTLVLLLSGSLSAQDAQRLGLAEGDSTALHALSSLAGERIPFMPGADYF